MKTTMKSSPPVKPSMDAQGSAAGPSIPGSGPEEPAPLQVIIGMGSNLGDRRAMLQRAVAALAGLGAIEAASSIYETEPVGPPQPSYLNAALRLRTQLSPQVLLMELLRIERAAGRERRVRWGPRTLDLDILWIRGRCLDTPQLQVPHPELAVRPFALIPLLELVPDATDPGSGQGYAELLLHLDCSTVHAQLGVLALEPDAVDTASS